MKVTNSSSMTSKLALIAKYLSIIQGVATTELPHSILLKKTEEMLESKDFNLSALCLYNTFSLQTPLLFRMINELFSSTLFSSKISCTEVMNSNCFWGRGTSETLGVVTPELLCNWVLCYIVGVKLGEVQRGIKKKKDKRGKHPSQ